MSRLGPTGLTQLLTNIKTWVTTKLGNYVTTDTTQTVTGKKLFTASSIQLDTVTSMYGSTMFIDTSASAPRGEFPAETHRVGRIYIGNGQSYNGAWFIVDPIISTNRACYRMVTTNPDNTDSTRFSIVWDSTKEGVRRRRNVSQGDLLPSGASTYNLGESGNAWQDAYINKIHGISDYTNLKTNSFNANTTLTHGGSGRRVILAMGTITLTVPAPEEGSWFLIKAVNGQVTLNLASNVTVTGITASVFSGPIYLQPNESILLCYYSSTTYNATMSTIRRSGIVGRNGNVPAENPKHWFKVAENYVTATYRDPFICLRVFESTTGNTIGTLCAHCRINNTVGVVDTSNCYLQWQDAGSSNDLSKYALTTNETSGTGVTITLWCMLTGGWSSLKFEVVTEYGAVDQLGNPEWVLTRRRQADGDLAELLDTDFTKIVYSTLTTLKNDTTGKASNVTGTVAIANGGTGATTRLNAVKNLTNESVGTPTHFLAITTNWGKAGYTTVAQAKTVLGITGDMGSHSDSEYVHMSGDETIGGNKTFSNNIAINGTYLGTEASTNERTNIYLLANRDTAGTSGAYIGRFRQNRTQGAMESSDVSFISFDFLENSTRYTRCFTMGMTDWDNDKVPQTYYLTSPDGKGSLGTATNVWNKVYANSYYLGTTAFGDIVTHNASEFLTSHQSLANYVTLNGAQTISGIKTISTHLRFRSANTRGTAPSANEERDLIDYKDSAGNRISLFETMYYTDKSSKTSIYAYKTTAATGGNIGSIGIGCDASGNVYTYAPTPASLDNSTKIATTAFVYNTAAKHLAAATNIYVAKVATGNGSGSNTSNYMALTDLRTYLATVHMHSSASNMNGSYNLQILFKAGDSFGDATFDATKMPGVRNLILNTSTGTNSTVNNYSTNSPTFGNITVTGDIVVTMRNLNCTGRISSQYGAQVSIDTYMGISSLMAANSGYLNVAKNMVINVCDAHVDYFCLAMNNGILSMWPGATVTINFRQQCYYTRALFYASSNGTAWIGYSSFKLTGTEPIAIWGSSGTLTGTSETAAATVEKAVTLASGQTFTLATNATAKVKFTVDNTAANPTLNIGGTGAKPIYWNNAPVQATMLMKNITYDVKYNGSQFVIQNAVKRLTNNDFGVFRSNGNYNQTYNSGSWNFTGWALYYGTGIENSNWRGSHIGNIQQNVSTSNNTYPVLISGTANATANTLTVPYFASGVKINPSTSTITATTFSGALTGNVTGNCSGSSGSCTGNAATATQFSANKSVTLTGDVTGTASSKAGWSVATTLANSGVTAGDYGPSEDASPAHSGTFTVPSITVDAKGRITAASTKTITLPADSNTDTKVTQTVTTANSGYPVLLCATANATTTGTTTSRFSEGLTVNARYSAIYMTNKYDTANTKGVRNTSSYSNGYIVFRCYDASEMGRIHCESSKNGYQQTYLQARSYIKNGAISPEGTATTCYITVRVRDNGSKTIYTDGSWENSLTPYANNTHSLGTSSLQWKNAYAVNIYENGTALSSKYALNENFGKGTTTHLYINATDFPTGSGSSKSIQYNDAVDGTKLYVWHSVCNSSSILDINPTAAKVTSTTGQVWRYLGPRVYAAGLGHDSASPTGILGLFRRES